MRRIEILSECYLFHFIVHRVEVAAGRMFKTSKPITLWSGIRTERTHTVVPCLPSLLQFLIFLDLERKMRILRRGLHKRMLSLREIPHRSSFHSEASQESQSKLPIDSLTLSPSPFSVREIKFSFLHYLFRYVYVMRCILSLVAAHSRGNKEEIEKFAAVCKSLLYFRNVSRMHL